MAINGHGNTRLAVKIASGPKPPSSNEPVETDSGLQRDAGCRLCSLHTTAEFVCLLGVGPAPGKAMIVGEAPGRREDDSGTPFVGRSGELLDDLLYEVGLDREDIYITNSVHCRPPDNKTPNKKEQRACKVWLDYEITKVKPKVVLLMGAVALNSVLGMKGIKSIRGQPIERDGVTYLPTWHPAYVLHDDAQRARPQLKADLVKFREMIRGGGMPQVAGLNHRIVKTWADVDDMIRHLKSIPGFVYDVETTGLYPWKNHLTSINIGDKRKQWCIPVQATAWNSPWTLQDIETIVERIDTLKKQKCNQNGKFDALWMKLYFGVDWRVNYDTMLAHYILDENGSHSLDDIAQEYYGALSWDVSLSLKQGHTGTLEAHARYSCLDILYTFMLWEDTEERLSNEPGKYKLFQKLLMPAARMFVDIETHGVTVDESKFGSVEHQLLREIAKCDAELAKHLPGVNWQSTKQVGVALFDTLKLTPLDKTAKGANSTSESVLKRLAEHHEVPRLLMKRRGAQQQLSFFIKGWRPWLLHIDGRYVLHPSFKLHGTVTGRLSCSDPNLQQVPRDPFIRQLIIAKKGWVLVEVDLSQIELRILAELSGDPEMLRCFQTGIDIHWLTAMREIFRGGGYRDQVIQTACAITGRNRIDYEDCHEILLRAGPDAAVDHGPPAKGDWIGWKEVRKKAKAINFGYAFGMWWKKFIVYARDNYDVIISEKDAQASRKVFFELYRRLENYHKKQRSFVRSNGYVRSLIGRKRHLPRGMDRDDSPLRGEAERQAINSPVQSLASDWNLMAALEIYDRYSTKELQIVGTVHDSILMEIREDRVAAIVPEIMKIMAHPKLLDEFQVELRTPIEAEAKVGAWGLGVSMKKWLAKEDVGTKRNLVVDTRKKLPHTVKSSGGLHVYRRNPIKSARLAQVS